MRLSSITVPCMPRDLGAFERLLGCWSDPRLFPLRPGESVDPIPLIVVLNRGDEEITAAFRNVFAQFVQLHSIFSSCVVLNANLDGDRDLYARNSAEAQGAFGNKAGPNFLFFETMRLVHSYGGFTFQNEVDCYPIREGWLTDLDALIEARRFAWVIGSYYTGSYPIGREIQYHFNGNAIYQSGDPDFIRFVDEVWEPRVLELVSMDPNLAYDCWWAVEQARASSVLRNTSWRLVSKYAQFFCNSQFLINSLHPDTLVEDVVEGLRNGAAVYRPCLFLHGHPCTPVIDAFLESDDDDLSAVFEQRAQEQDRPGFATGLDEDIATIVDDVADLDALWQASSGNDFKASTQMVKSKPISVEELPFFVTAKEIDLDCFAGNWHRRGKANHVWAGGGAAGLSVKFAGSITRARVTLRGRVPQGSDAGLPEFHAFGAANVAINRTSGSVVIDVEDAAGFEMLSLVIEQPRPVTLPSDTRDLAYALYSVEIV